MDQVIRITKNLDYKYHLMVSVVIRFVLIIYGEVQDSISLVPYTDIDYKVITDGARHVWNGDSPYKRHTYRYTPLLAYLVLPNVFLHGVFGKFLFAIFDIAVGILIKKIIYNEFYWTYKQKGYGKAGSNFMLPPKFKLISEWSSLLWLYNPLTMVIATRGNGDSISSFLIIFTLYFIMKPTENTAWSCCECFLAGIIHGIAIHFRIYPIMFSLAYFLCLASGKLGSISNVMKSILVPNKHQISLVLGTIFCLLNITCLFFYLYGYEFLQESYMYHLVRRDIRHNFSVYFYMQYLSVDVAFNWIEKICILAPQILILITLTYVFGCHRKTLPLCLFAMTYTMVTFNSVVTSQYFVWFLSLLPLCAKNLIKLQLKQIIFYVVIWLGAQGGWLLSAYLLEFRGWNTFAIIWTQGLLFFAVNVFVLQRLISNYDVISDMKLQPTK